MTLMPWYLSAQPAHDSSNGNCQTQDTNNINRINEALSWSDESKISIPRFAIRIYQKGNYLKSSKEPYAEFQPKPFYYKQDIASARKKKVQPFKIAGVNCDNVIRSTSTITGVSVEYLSLRARGITPYQNSEDDKVRPLQPEWKGAPEFSFRASGGGFINEKFPPKDAGELRRQKDALRALLLADNKTVRSFGVSHQQVAAPILTAIEQRMHSASSNIVINGEEFSVIATDEGQYWFGDRNRDDGVNNNDSGWIGNNGLGHIQGSIFDDELATSGKRYRFVRKHPKEGLENELTIDGLTPHLIYRYGFYQGGEYRIDPLRITKFFGIQPSKTDVWKACD